MDKHRTLFPGAMAQEGLGVVHKSKLPRDIAQSINSGDADTRQGVGPMLPKKPNTAETQPNKLRKTVFAINLPTNSSSPWDRYQPILIENQAGTATLAHGNNPSFPIVAIKCRKCSPEELRHVTQCRHENITAFTETYHHDDQIYFIYECVMMSLAEVQSTPCNDFAPYEIAAVSKAILTGLNYLQSSLDISHGALCSSNIVFALGGQGHLSIQIANVGDSMLKATIDTHRDLSALGSIIVEMANPSASASDCTGHVLADDPSAKSMGSVKGFLESIGVQEITALLKVSYDPQG